MTPTSRGSAMSFRSLLYSCAGAAVMAVVFSPLSSAETLLSPAEMDGVTAGTADNETIVSHIIVGDSDLSTKEILSRAKPTVRVRVDSGNAKLRPSISVDDATVSIRGGPDGSLERTLSRIQSDGSLGVASAEATSVSTVANGAVTTTRESRTMTGSKLRVVIQSQTQSRVGTGAQSISQSIRQAIRQ